MQGRNTIVEKVTVRFPGPTGSNSSFAGLSIPGPLDQGSVLAATVVGGVPRESNPKPAYHRAAEFAAHRLPIQSYKDCLPLSAIMISPDSAIHGCSISVSGRTGEIDTYRCSPGNPVIMPMAYDPNIWIYPISGIPVINQVDWGIAWDATLVKGFQSTTDETCWAFPLRLMLIYGDIPSMSHMRSTYHGYIRTTDTDMDGEELYYHFCIDGRKRVVIDAISDAATTCLVEARFVFGEINATFPAEMRAANTQALSVTPAGATNVDVADSSWTRFAIESPDGDMLPSPILRLHFQPVGLSTLLEVKVTATD